VENSWGGRMANRTFPRKKVTHLENGRRGGDLTEEGRGEGCFPIKRGLKEDG